MIPDAGALREALAAAGVDGWLLYAFHGLNPVATRVLELTGLNTRRLFVLLPREGEPVAVAHRIELAAVEGFPGRVLPYARWEELHAALGQVVRGKRLAMEISPEDAVPYLDRVPAGVVELLRRLGATIVPSGPLVSRFAAGWSAEEAADHRAAAEVLAEVAQAELARAVGEGDTGLTETGLQARVVAAVEARGLVFDTLPIVGFGPNSANPHYEPHAGRDATLRSGEVVLLDLWAGRSRTTVFADQTWMGFSGQPGAAQGPAGVGDGARRAGRGGGRRARGGGGGPADRGVRGRPGRASGGGGGRPWRAVRAPDGALDRPRAARLGAAPRRLRDPRRPAAGAWRRVLGGARHLPARRVRRAERGQHALERGRSRSHAARATDPAHRSVGVGRGLRRRGR